MDYRGPIASQYYAALEMLKQSILACPEALWQDSESGVPLAQIAYHALFFTHLYLQESEQAFSPWSGHRAEYQFEDDVPDRPAQSPAKAVVLEYLAFCQRQVAENVPALSLDAASGFDWLRFTKFELQLYSIRHIQQHAGELMERLGARAADVGWVGSYQIEKHTGTSC